MIIFLLKHAQNTFEKNDRKENKIWSLIFGIKVFQIMFSCVADDSQFSSTGNVKRKGK